MSTSRIYTVATAKNYPEVIETLEAAIDKFHFWIDREKVKVKTVMAFGPRGKEGEISGPAIKMHGRPAWACIKALSDLERVAQNADVLLQIDGDKWGDLPDETQLALLDHELEHLQTKLERDGTSKRRDDGSLILGTKPDDFEINGFYDVIRRHGLRSLDLSQVKLLVNNLREQLNFDFMTTDSAPLRTRKAAKR